MTARPRKGTRAPKERNKRRGKQIEAMPATDGRSFQDRLAARAPETVKELIVEQTRRLVALAEETRLLRQKAAKAGRCLTKDEMEPIQLEGRLRSAAVKAATANREERDDWGVDILEVGIGECLQKPHATN